MHHHHRRPTKVEKIVAQRFTVARRAYELVHARLNAAKKAEHDFILLMVVLEPLLDVSAEAALMADAEWKRRNAITALVREECDEAQKRFDEETRAGMRLGIVKVKVKV